VKNNRDPGNVTLGDPLSSVLIPLFLAGADDTVHSSFGAAVKEHKRLFYNNAAFLLWASCDSVNRPEAFASLYLSVGTRPSLSFYLDLVGL